MQPSKGERTPMYKGNAKDMPNPPKSPQGKPPAPAKEDLVMPKSSPPGGPCQAQNTHHALHTPAPNQHANRQTRAPPTKTPRPQQSSRLDHYVCFYHSWCMNSIDHEYSYDVTDMQNK